MEENIKQIISISIHAPSGDNMQPWRFEIQDNRVRIFNVPSRDTSLYNYGQHGAYIAHGALLENIKISSLAAGYIANIFTEKTSTNPNLIAEVGFTPTEKKEIDLFQYIKKRATNRTKYKNLKLDPAQKQYLLSGLEPNLLIAEDAEKISKLSFCISQGDRMIFENKFVHSFLFDHIRWSEKEELQKKDGLYLKAMELNPIQRGIFKFVKKWSRMQILNKIGFPKMAVKSNEELYKHGCGFGAIILDKDTKENYLKVGEIMQIFWLRATKLGLGLQPLTGIPLLASLINTGNWQEYLTNSQKDLIMSQYQKIKDIFGLDENRQIGFFFRFGFPSLSSTLGS